MTTPSYQFRDPKGWCGNPARGAALGRPSVQNLGVDFAERIFLRRVRLNSGGYDTNGTYFGHGEPLYWAASADNEIDFMLRARSRADAIAQVREIYPNAKIRK